MKTIIFLAAFVSTTVAADTAVIAQSRQSDGFSNQACRSTEVKVYNDGKVIHTRCRANPELVTTLSAKAVSGMVALAANLVPGDLDPVVPNRPSCMDAPSLTHSVFNSAGEEVDVGGNWGCNEMMYAGYNYGASRLASILDGLFNLTKLK